MDSKLRSDLVTQFNQKLITRRLSTMSRFAPPEVVLPARKQAAPLAQLGELGLDSKKIARLEDESVAESREFVKAVRDHRAKLPPADPTRYVEAKRRFLAASPGSQYLVPIQAQRFSMHYPLPVPMPAPTPGPVVQWNNEVLQPILLAEGNGLGWTTDNSYAESVIAYWNFAFTPPTTANYAFKAFVWADGRFLLQANDQWWNSKDANAYLDWEINVGVLQGAVLGGGLEYWPNSELNPNDERTFSMGDDNINQSGEFTRATMLEYDTVDCDGMLAAGAEVIVSAAAIGVVYAQGAGAISELDFTGAGLGIGCPLLAIDQIMPT